MSSTYNVYQHVQRGHWGYAVHSSGNGASTAAITPEGLLTAKTISKVALAAAIQDRVKQGYVKVAHARYLRTYVEQGCLRGEFVTRHPDLMVEQLAGDLLFFVALPAGVDMPEVVQGWREQLDGTPGDGAARAAWLQHATRATGYVPAVMGGSPCEVLVLAEWARSRRLALVSAMRIEVPTGAPSAQRYEWRAYLTTWWSQTTVVEALAALDWPLHEVLHTPVAAVAPEGCGGQAGWEDFQQFGSF